ncbi:MAG: hypothetical protein LAT65_16590 [Saccharospirillum sp.]|nr:hypothetical protein [Saccharospirillum sp.]
MMVLPGGILRAGQRHQDCRLAAPNGRVALALTDSLVATSSHPLWVSQTLVVILDELAGEAPCPADVEALCVADRQWLAIQWHLHTAEQPERPAWFSADCQACTARYDFSPRWQDVPLKPAAESYPYADVKLSLGQARFRVPNGLLQQQLAQTDRQDTRRCIAEALWVSLDGQPPPVHGDRDLSEADLDAIESELEAVSPELGLTLATRCPECGSEQVVTIDPYSGLASPPHDLLADIHCLASHYHWSEDAILDLPDSRRRHYLKLIDRDLGQHGQGGH